MLLGIPLPDRPSDCDRMVFFVNHEISDCGSFAPTISLTLTLITNWTSIHEMASHTERRVLQYSRHRYSDSTR